MRWFGRRDVLIWAVSVGERARSKAVVAFKRIREAERVSIRRVCLSWTSINERVSPPVSAAMSDGVRDSCSSISVLLSS